MNHKTPTRKPGPVDLAKGFSLIELLIVVAIILIIAAIAIPSLLRSRIAANEAAAASSVRTIASAEYTYNSAYPSIGFAADIASLGGSAAACTPSSATACIVDSALTAGTKSGYQFLAKGFDTGSGTNTTFVVGSAPSSYNITGVRNFCMITDGAMRIHPGGVSAANDVPTCTAYPVVQ